MAKNTIIVRSYNKVRDELIATAAVIKPGMLLERDSANKAKAHATAQGTIAVPMFAIEDQSQGKGIEDDYAAGARISCTIPTRGDIINALLADGENVAVGDKLASGGDGYLKKYVAVVASSDEDQAINPNPIVGIALQAVDMSDSSGADPVGRIEVLIG